MKTETADLARVLEAVEQLRQEMGRLTDRVAALESTTAQPADQAAPVVEQEISEEIVMVISAAIAAFLGKKPQIRQIRLLSRGVWAEQGRATIQASHALAGRNR